MDDLLTSYPPAEEAPQLQSAPGLGPQIPNPMLQSAPGLNQPRPPPEPPQEFTQADSLRAQRLQAGLSAAQSQVDDGTLAPEEGAQLQQHINRVLQPLRQRQQQTQARQRQQMKSQLMDETALQESMEAQHARLAAQAFPETVSQFTDPMSGRTEHFYQHKRGEWKPIEYGVDQQERDRRAEDLRQLATGADSGTGPGEDPTLEQMVNELDQSQNHPFTPTPLPPEPDYDAPKASVDYFPLGLGLVPGQDDDAPPAGDSSEYGQFIRRLAEKDKPQQPQEPQQAPPEPEPAELSPAEYEHVRQVMARLPEYGPRPQDPRAQLDPRQPVDPHVYHQVMSEYQQNLHRWDAQFNHLANLKLQGKKDDWRREQAARAAAARSVMKAANESSMATARAGAEQMKQQEKKAKEAAALQEKRDAEMRTGIRHYLKEMQGDMAWAKKPFEEQLAEAKRRHDLENDMIHPPKPATPQEDLDRLKAEQKRRQKAMPPPDWTQGPLAAEREAAGLPRKPEPE